MLSDNQEEIVNDVVEQTAPIPPLTINTDEVAPAVTLLAVPSLIGQLSADNVFSGFWAMSDAAHAVPSQRSEFEYRLVKKADAQNEAFPSSGRYQGYFYLQTTVNNKTVPVKIEEKDVTFTFSKDEESDELKIHGEGSNKFGKFSINGIFNTEGNSMKVYKEYIYSSLPINKKKLPATPAKLSPRPSLGAPGSTTPSGAVTPRESSGRVKKPTAIVAEMLSTTEVKKEKPMKSTPPKPVPAPAPTLVHFPPAPTHESSRNQRMSHVMVRCNDLLKELLRHPSGVWFAAPVDPVKLNIPDYFTIITQPMDFGTIKEKIDSGLLTSADNFAELVRLVFRNAITYNQLPENPVHIAAKELSKKFEDRFRSIISHHQLQHQQFLDPAVVVKTVKKPVINKARASTGSVNFSSRHAHAGPGAYIPPVMDDASRHIMEMQRQMMELQSEISRLRSSVMKSEINASLEERREAAQNPLSFEEKKALIAAIHTLPVNKLEQVIAIIQAALPPEKSQIVDGEDVEIPLDDLDTLTLRKLQSFVDQDTVERRKRMRPDVVDLPQSNAKKGKRESGAGMKSPRAVTAPAQTFFAQESFDTMRNTAANRGKSTGYLPLDTSNSWDVGDIDLDISDSVVAQDANQLIKNAASIPSSGGTNVFQHNDVLSGMWGAAVQETRSEHSREIENARMREELDRQKNTDHAARVAALQRSSHAAISTISSAANVEAQRLENLRNAERSMLQEINQTVHIQQNREDFILFDTDDL